MVSLEGSDTSRVTALGCQSAACGPVTVGPARWRPGERKGTTMTEDLQAETGTALAGTRTAHELQAMLSPRRNVGFTAFSLELGRQTVSEVTEARVCAAPGIVLASFT